MTEQYLPKDINLSSGGGGADFVISTFSDFLLVPGVLYDTAAGTVTFTTAASLAISGQVQIPEGVRFIDDVGADDEPGIVLVGTSASLDRIIGNVDDALWRGLDGVNFSNIFLRNESTGANAWVVRTSNRFSAPPPPGIPPFRASTIDSCAVAGLRGIWLDGVSVSPLGAGVLGVQISRCRNLCTRVGIRLEGFVAGIGIVGLINTAEGTLSEPLEVIQVATFPGNGGPIGIRDCRLFVSSSAGPGASRGIVFDNVIAQSFGGSFGITNNAFEVSNAATNPEDGIFDNATMSEVVPGAGNLIVSEGNVFLGSDSGPPPIAIASYPASFSVTQALTAAVPNTGAAGSTINGLLVDGTNLPPVPPGNVVRLSQQAGTDEAFAFIINSSPTQLEVNVTLNDQVSALPLTPGAYDVEYLDNSFNVLLTLTGGFTVT